MGSGWAGAEVVAAAQRGDAAALTEVVRGAHPHVRRFAHYLCRSDDDAEEAAQEALIILYRRIGSLRATGAIASWMFRIVRNECLRRTRALVERGVWADSDVVASAEDEVLRRFDTERITAAIGALPEVQRRVLVMRDLLGHSGRTTADALGLSTTAMKSQLHRARTTLRHNLGSS